MHVIYLHLEFHRTRVFGIIRFQGDAILGPDKQARQVRVQILLMEALFSSCPGSNGDPGEEAKSG